MTSTSGSDERIEWCLSQFKLHGKPIYEGNHSKVWIATDLEKQQRKVAIKAYKSKKLGTLERMQITREITIHKQLNHVNVIRLYGSFQDENYHYVVTELAAGTLFDKLKEKNRLHAQEACLRFAEGDVALDVIKPLLEALGYVHSKGLIHRDIKPENILVSTDGVLKLADFGLVIDSNQERPVSRLGTLDYMAPEVLACPVKNHPTENKDRADLAYSTQIDSWAVGVLAYEMLVGKPPFERGTRLDTEHNIMFEEPDMNVPWLSGQAKDFIKSALNKFPRSRSTIEKLKKHSWLKYAKKPAHSSGPYSGLDPLLLLSSDEEDQEEGSPPFVSAQASSSSFSSHKITKNDLLEVAKSSKSLSALRSRPPSIVTMARQEVHDSSSSPSSPNFPPSLNYPVSRQGSGGLISPLGRRPPSPSKLIPLSTHHASDSSPEGHAEGAGTGLLRMKSGQSSEGPSSGTLTSEKNTTPSATSSQPRDVLSAINALGLVGMSKSSSSRDLRAMAAATHTTTRAPRTSITAVDDDHDLTSDTSRLSPSAHSYKQGLRQLSSVFDSCGLRDVSPLLGHQRRRVSSNDGGSKEPLGLSHLCPTPTTPSILSPRQTLRDGKRTSSTNLPLLNPPHVIHRLGSARQAQAQASRGGVASKTAGGAGGTVTSPQSDRSTSSLMSRDLRPVGGLGSSVTQKTSPQLPKVPSLSMDALGRRGSSGSHGNISSPSGVNNISGGSQTSRFSSVPAGSPKPPLPGGNISGGGGQPLANSTQRLQPLKK